MVFAMDTRTSVPYVNIFMPYIEKQSLSKTFFKPDIVTFFEEANLHDPTIKFTTEITETMFLDSVVYKGTRSNEKLSLM